MNFMMHMADGLISIPVGVIFYVVIGFLIAYAIKKCNTANLSHKVALMGVMGAFVFAGQMINFTIPGTGSSGHILGSIMLAMVLGQYPAFLSIVAVLVIQALLFGDGGLLALGCNIFNMGVLPLFVAYPLIVKPILNKFGINGKTLTIASILSCIVGIELGALSVSLQTLASHITALPFTTFIALMLPIHVVIGLVEGLITSAVVGFVYKYSPVIIEDALYMTNAVESKKASLIIGLSALVIAGGLSLFASSHPDGLEWSIASITGSTEIKEKNTTKKEIAKVQEQTSLLPDYAFKNDDSPLSGASAGIIGAGVVLVVAGGAGYMLSKKHRHE
ncbi:energy-coupling factor ABC transporter permease [Sharpea azabuensis]|uniref:energy-coupling factor ABC transporter permease n=1 Tax=Sharpea azabuensis TaxID=322505 RepID=UPI0023F322A2|nr:energy-coupling factor ABC transporter permease [Sharpea azabuensis]